MRCKNSYKPIGEYFSLSKADPWLNRYERAFNTNKIMAAVYLGIALISMSFNVHSIFILWRLLPHGIFELPAVIISIGIGIKIGLDIWKKDAKQRLKRNFKEAIRLFIFVILPLLLIAGIIEGVLVRFLG